MGKIKIGVNVWSYPSSIGIKDMVKHAKNVGYDLFEPAVDDSDLEILDSPEFRRRWSEVKEAAESVGIGIETIATGLYWKYNMVLEDQFEKAAKVLEAQAKAASITGAKVILLVPGVAVPELSYGENLNRVKAALLRLEKVARDYGIVVGVENVWNRLFASPLDMKNLLNDLDPKVFGAYLDVGNTLPHSLPEHWIMELKGRIAAMHAKDFLAEPNRCTFGIPFTGSVNWGRIRRLLDEVGYSGPLTAEVPPYPGDPFKAAADAASSLRQIFGG